MANHTQTGSIDLTSSYSVHQVAQAGFESAAESYATKTEVTQTADSITQSINSLSSRVDSKADNSTVQTLRSEYNETKTTVSGHETRLSATESVANGVRTDFDNLEIGGRNLLWHSAQFREGSVENPNVMRQTVDEAGYYKMEILAGKGAENYNASWWALGSFAGTGDINNILTVGDVYTVSMVMRAEGSTVIPTLYLNSYNGYKQLVGELSENWSIVSYTFIFAGNGTRGPHLGWSAVTAESTYWIKAWKIERGNKATDWTPAPEDLESEVTSLKTDYANYKQTTTEALSEIGTTYATKTELGTETSNRQTAIQQVNNAIALKANSSDVYTKQQSDGLISTEVSNRNSAIQQSAEAINLSVSQNYTTKTEFNALEVGGRNLFIGRNQNSTTTTANGLTVTWSKDDLTLTVKGTNTKTDAAWGAFNFASTVYDKMLFDVGDQVTASFILVSGDAYGLYLGVNFWSATSGVQYGGPYPDAGSHRTFTLPEYHDSTKPCAGVFLGVAAATREVDCVLRVKIERGNKATDWTPAPEDQTAYTDSQISAAKAEIKVTTDGITSEVSKVSSVKYFVGNSSTLANIKVWAAEGYSSSWGLTSGNTDGLRIGDTVYLKYGDTTRNCSVYIKGTVTAFTINTITFTSHGYEDVLPVDTAISTINQSAESVKIAASKVEIDGTTTFTSGGTLASYVEGKAEDAANAVEIGGRNLVIDSKNFRAGNVQEPLTMSSSIEDGMYKMVISDGNTANWNANWWPNKDAGWSNVENNLSTGDPFVISFEMRAIGSTVIPNIYIKDSIGYKAMSGTLSESWSTVYYAGTWSDSTYINPHFGWSAVNTASTYYVKSVKVEKGNKPTDWTPAPEDVAANAVNRTQRIYYRSNAAITSWSMPASWVTNDQNTWNNGMSAAGWSTKVTPIASGTGESAAKYLYLYTCEQRQMADGTIYHTPVTLDESTTVIDGGNIITGSITANQVNFADATGNQLKLFDPSSPTNYQAISSTATEFVVGGESRMLISGSGQRIGKEYVQGATDNESHMELDYHSMQMVDKDGNTYFHVSDLRDASGYAELSETFTGDGLSRSYMVFYPARSAETSAVTVDGDPVSFTSTIGATHTSFTLSTAPQSGATVVISYQTNSDRVKAYTLGKRLSGTRLGAYSFCEGEDTTASENCCHAEGYGTTASYGYSHAEGRNSTASGNISHAEGEGAIASGAVSHAEGQVTVASGYASHAQNEGTKAASEAQTAIGKYNVEDSNDTYALIIGNGTAENARSNAFAVKWDGTVETAQDIPWTTLTLASGWTEYSSARAPKYRRVGALVEIRGAIKPTASTTLNATAVTFANLPQGCRPANMEVSAVCNGSATKMWLLTVDTDGNVGASRMRTTNSTSYQSAGTSEFMIFDVMFFAG